MAAPHPHILQVVLWLMRHGDVDRTDVVPGAPFDPPLSDDGRWQVNAAFERHILPELTQHDASWDGQLWNSGLVRARQSAESIGSFLLQLGDRCPWTPVTMSAPELNHQAVMSAIPEHRARFLELCDELEEGEDTTMHDWQTRWSHSSWLARRLAAWAHERILVDLHGASTDLVHHIVGITHHPLAGLLHMYPGHAPATWPNASIFRYTVHFNGISPPQCMDSKFIGYKA